MSDSNGANRKRPAPSMRNPYAKKPAAASAAPAATKPVMQNPYARNKKPPPAKPSNQPPPRPRPPKTAPVVNPAPAAAGTTAMPRIQPTSFSQAFDDEEFDTTADSAAANSNDNSNNGVTVDTNHIIRHPELRDFHLNLQPHVLGVSPRQQGNGLLKYIRNVPVQLCNMVPDYIMSSTSCALFLSIKYHQLYPEYIRKRIDELGHMFKTRVLLVLVDVDDCAHILLQLNKLGVTASMSVILAWTEQEAARYLESFKALDGKDASSIQKRTSNNVVDQMTDFLTTCKPMNKTDAATVWQHFRNLKGIANASQDELALCPGLGKVKTQRLFAALHKPFSKRATRERQRQKKEAEEKAKLEDEEKQKKQAAKDDKEEEQNEYEF